MVGRQPARVFLAEAMRVPKDGGIRPLRVAEARPACAPDIAVRERERLSGGRVVRALQPLVCRPRLRVNVDFPHNFSR